MRLTVLPVAGLSFSIEASSDLSTWTPLPGLPDGAYEYEAPMDEAARYFRVRYQH